MKSLKTCIYEAKYDDTYFLLNKSGIAGNRKLEKLAKSGGVKYKGEYWFVSAAGVSKEDAEEMKSPFKNDDNFAVAPYTEIESGYGK